MRRRNIRSHLTCLSALLLWFVYFYTSKLDERVPELEWLSSEDGNHRTMVLTFLSPLQVLIVVTTLLGDAYHQYPTIFWSVVIYTLIIGLWVCRACYRESKRYFPG